MPGFLSIVSKNNLNLISEKGPKELIPLQKIISYFYSLIDRNSKFELLSDKTSPIVALKYRDDATTKFMFEFLQENRFGTILTEVKGIGLVINFYLNSEIKEFEIENLIRTLNKKP
jgi:Holliday junction resolvasome RuvABC DNA-binding subunit